MLPGQMFPGLYVSANKANGEASWEKDSCGGNLLTLSLPIMLSLI